MNTPKFILLVTFILSILGVPSLKLEEEKKSPKNSSEAQKPPVSRKRPVAEQSPVPEKRRRARGSINYIDRNILKFQLEIDNIVMLLRKLCMCPLKAQIDEQNRKFQQVESDVKVGNIQLAIYHMPSPKSLLKLSIANFLHFQEAQKDLMYNLNLLYLRVKGVSSTLNQDDIGTYFRFESLLNHISNKTTAINKECEMTEIALNFLIQKENSNIQLIQDAKDIDILKNHLSKLLQAINDINKNTNAFVIELKQKKAGALEKVTVKKDGKYEKSEALKKILRDIKIKESEFVTEITDILTAKKIT